MNNHFLRPTILSLLLVVSLLSAHSQKKIMDVTRVADLEFDGNPFDEQWNAIDPLPMTVFSPTYQGEATERTDIRIAYDDRYFYLAGRFYDSDPEGIQGNSLIRDRNTGGDFLNVMIDSFNDNETFWYFGTMPSGPRIDAEIPQDAEGQNVFNTDWNTFWDVKTIEADSGWFAEMRIPFSSLRFKGEEDEVIFGFSTNRLIGRKFERHTFPNIPPNWAAAVWKASQASKLRITGIRSPKPLYFTPYLLSGFSRENTPDTDMTIRSKDNWRKEIGGDLKIGLSSNFTLDLTANTDFAQVEADNFQSNLTRFSLFFPEKRQFFQERAGMFNFQLSGMNRLFHSRLIGLTADGRPQQVYGGARLIGRTKGFDLGLLNMHTHAVDSLGSLNFGVLRMRQRVFNLNSYVGGILTTRFDQLNNYNVTYGLDALFRVHNQNFLTVKGGESFQNGESSDDYFLYGKWEKRAFQGLGYSLELDKTSDGFNPGIGFILRRNLTFTQTASYGFFLKDSKRFRSVTPSLTNTLYLKNAGSELESQSTEGKVDVALLNGSAIGFGYRRIFDQVTSTFQIGEAVEVGPGDYTFHAAGVSYKTNENKRFIVSTSGEFGQYYEGKRAILNVNPVLIISRHLEFSGGYTYDDLEFDDPDQSIRADIGYLNTLIAFNIHWSITSLMQYNALTDKFGINTRLRYNRREGNDLFVVFNHLTNYNPATTERNSPLVENWSVMVKYTHALNLNRK